MVAQMGLGEWALSLNRICRPIEARIADRVVKSCGHDSHDCVRFVADFDGLTDYIGRRGEIRDPEFMTENCHTLSRLLFLNRKVAPQNRTDADCWEKIGRNTAAHQYACADAIIPAEKPRNVFVCS